MANLSQQRRERMLDFLEKIKSKNKDDDDALVAIGEIENELTEKKFGLVWEQHSEKVDERLIDEVPIFLEEKSKELSIRDNDQYNFILEGDNLHSLYLLAKTHKEKIDVIYIDPPYNTGAKDWKYNNDYVDGNDEYRHSKWLSMMKARLDVAKKLLKSDTGTLIVTIDENEVHHVRCMLEEMFPQSTIQMVTCVINPKGVFQGKLSRVEEYIIYCFMPQAHVCTLPDAMLGENKAETAAVRWKGLLRSGSKAKRSDNKNEFYPILIDEKTGKIIKALDPVPVGVHPDLNEKIDGYTAVYPIRTDMSEGIWGVTAPTLNRLIEKGYVALGRYDEKRNTYGLSFLTSGIVEQIETGEVVITRRDPVTNVVTVAYKDYKAQNVKTVWHRTRHDAGAYGTDLLFDILGSRQSFSFPKSLYSEIDALKVVINDNPNALVLDFFAGSGTTGHAVLEMNKEDGGNRHFIVCTNNENGICEKVTYPRLKTIMTGVRDNGSKYSRYIPANLKYYKTDFIPKNTDSLVEELMSHVDELIQLEYGVKIDKDKYISILTDEEADELEEKWESYPDIQAIYISRSVLLTGTQNELFHSKDCYVIPDYYYREELREAGEA